MLTVATERQTRQLIQLGQQAVRTNVPYFFASSHIATRVQLTDEKIMDRLFHSQDYDTGDLDDFQHGSHHGLL